MDFEGKGLAFDSGGGVGCLSMLGGGFEAIVSNSFSVGMLSLSPRPWASEASMERSGWINFHMACIA